MKAKRHKKDQSRRQMLGDFPLSFGKYAGRTIQSIPRQYLRWAANAHGKIPSSDQWAIMQYLRELRSPKQKPR